MKGGINQIGSLYIERRGDMKRTHCALKAIPGLRYRCAADCVAFREPVKRGDGKTELQLCNEVGTLVFDEFTDER